MDKNVAELEKWGFPLQELYRMALQFYKRMQKIPQLNFININWLFLPFLLL